MKITFPDGSSKEVEKGLTVLEIVKTCIGEGLARSAVAAKFNDELVDLTRQIKEDGKLVVLTCKDAEGKDVLRHSAAHVMAQAIMRLYKEAVLTIGPTVEDGFYYDIDHRPFTPEDLEKIEKEMEKIVKEDLKVERIELTKKEAQKMFKGNKYKLELIKDMEGKITAYKQGDFVDLCRGPHVPSTGSVKAFKLTKLAGAYWKGDSKNQQLQRIYGVVFPSKKELEEYVKLREEAEKRDHRKVGKELDLFMHHELALPGSPFFLPNGTIIYNELLKLIREEYVKRDYQEVLTPQLFKKQLWETSGHWEHYKDSMFMLNIGGEEYSLKPMNCPSHVLIYKNQTRSYRDLPLKIADFCPLHRNELAGVLGGLTRVTKFCQDDSHIFVAPEQIGTEMAKLLDFVDYLYNKVFKFTFTVKLSTRPDKFMGEKKLWDEAEAVLKKVLDEKKMNYIIKEGEGAFYGPKIDFDINDSLGRPWQCATIQLDFQLPLRFGATYEGQDGKKHTVIMIHRAILGSIERFIGVLIEHYAGKFPMWLSPRQVILLPIADRHAGYANEIAKQMKDKGLRVEVDSRTETTSKKVRDAQVAQINYILVVGDNEIKNKTVNVRTRDNKVLGEKPADGFVNELAKEVEERR